MKAHLAETPNTSPGHALVRRWPTLLALVAVVVFFADGASELQPFALLLPVMAASYLVFGAFRRELRRPGMLALQVAGLLAFTGVAFVVLSVNEPLGRYLLAAGWLAHGVWDFVHHRLNRVVPRAYAEWCGVVDILGAAAILFLP